MGAREVEEKEKKTKGDNAGLFITFLYDAHFI